jgi:flagellar hook protein FlgE
MAFGIALSGIDAAQKNLSVTANNVANAATTGFKSSSAQFAELFAVSPQGVSNTQAGNGVRISQVAQNFTQGNITSTGNSLDMAISGEGMFTVSDHGAMQYSRSGAFQTDSSGYIVNAAGQRLQVFKPTTAGSFDTTSLSDLQLVTGDSAPAATTTSQVVYNLPANATPPSAAFSPADPTSYNQSTSITLYDSLGAVHTASLYFVNTGPNSWNAFEYIDAKPVNLAPVKLTYGPSGILAAVTDAAGNGNLGAVSFGAFTPTSTGASAIDVGFDLSKSTQYGDTFGVSSVTQNGYTTGKMSGISVDSSGIVQANYTNGRSVALGQIALANFPNQEGLQQVGNTNWTQTYGSGTPLYGPAGGSGFGLVQSGALEESNVDITAQLVQMITAQRAFQANAQMISTENQITQSIINIRS